MSEPLIRTVGLTKYFQTPKGMLHAVEDVNLRIDKGETLGVVGESGCGKTTLGRVLMRLVEATSGEVQLNGENILLLKGREKINIYNSLQMIFQDPYSSLNPRLSIGNIIEDPIKTMGPKMSKKELNDRVLNLMDIVGLPPRYYNSYPHELDGGRRQRVGLARALALNPKFIVCDEPVSALDVSIQAQILNLLMDLQEQNQLSYMFITHNLFVVQHISSHIAVMYMGQIVEYGTKEKLFSNPTHPYTKALLAAVPQPDLSMRNQKREILHGEVTSPINPAPGCRFAARCPYVKKQCTEAVIPLTRLEEGHHCACILCQ
ncbi:ABC transporter ATP-binding protein [Enterocloster asparagiformis]|uniref:ABC transporter ATP-binding protein n=1 Tax=Enterocloster asparagiformis TaxID=333367 RepID=UPI000465DFC1|nr:ABC transporter ATP-binding protein [Enterocloster asparagiformis]